MFSCRINFYSEFSVSCLIGRYPYRVTVFKSCGSEQQLGALSPNMSLLRSAIKTKYEKNNSLAIFSQQNSGKNSDSKLTCDEKVSQKSVVRNRG